MTETKRLYVLGCDPGTTTGLSLVRFDESGVPHMETSCQLEWRAAAERAWRLVESLQGHLALEERAAAVCEQYTLNSKTAQRGQHGAEDAMGMNGVVRLACLENGVPYAQLQQASAAKNAVTDDTLKNLGLHVRGKTHVNDATRHAVLYAMKKQALDLTLALASTS